MTKKRRQKAAAAATPKKEHTSERPIFGRRSTWVALGIIAVVCLVVFARVVFGGEILTGGDVLAGAAIFEHYANEEIAAGNLPLWNPYMFAGMPFFESMTWSAFVYPTFWLKYGIESLTGSTMPRLFFLVMHYLLAGLGMFFFLRSRGVGHGGSTAGGLAFMLTPHLVGLATIGHGGKVLTAAYIPLILMAAFHVLEGKGRRWVAVLGMLGGLQFLARHVQVSYYTWLVVLVLFVYILVADRRAGKEWPVLGRRTGELVTAGVLAAALAAVILVPLLQYSGFSTRVAEGGGMGYDQAVQWSFHPKEILTFLNPSLFGLANETYWGTMPFQQVSHYMGYVALCLAAIAVVRKRDRDVRFLVVLFAVGLFLSFGRHIGPVYRLLYAVLPGFSRFRVPALFLLVSQFAVAALAGHGASALLGELDTGSRSWVRIAGAVAGVGLAAGLIMLAANSEIARTAATELMKKHPGVPASALRELGRAAARMVVRDSVVLMVAAVATGALVFLAGTRRLKGWVVAAILLALLVADVALVNARFVKPERMLPLERYYPRTEAVRYLQQQDGPFRIAPAGREFSSNAWMYHGIESIGGYHPAKLTLVDRLINQVGIGNLKLLAMLNVRYVVGPESLGHPAFRTVAPGVHEFMDTLPRVFLVGEARTAGSEGLMLTEYGIDSFDPTAYASVLGNLPGPVESVEGSTARVISHDPHEIEVAASVGRPCLLVFSEVYYPPGWKAYVDGEEVEIFQTNYAFRSVYLEPGEHTVVMRHGLSSLGTGLTVSLIALAAIAALALVPAGQPFRRKKQ
jgi:hypothetical protein